MSYTHLNTLMKYCNQPQLEKQADTVDMNEVNALLANPYQVIQNRFSNFLNDELQAAQSMDVPELNPASLAFMRDFEIMANTNPLMAYNNPYEAYDKFASYNQLLQHQLILKAKELKLSGLDDAQVREALTNSDIYKKLVANQGLEMLKYISNISGGGLPTEEFMKEWLPYASAATIDQFGGVDSYVNNYIVPQQIGLMLSQGIGIAPTELVEDLKSKGIQINPEQLGIQLAAEALKNEHYAKLPAGARQRFANYIKQAIGKNINFTNDTARTGVYGTLLNSGHIDPNDRLTLAKSLMNDSALGLQARDSAYTALNQLGRLSTAVDKGNPGSYMDAAKELIHGNDDENEDYQFGYNQLMQHGNVWDKAEAYARQGWEDTKDFGREVRDAAEEYGNQALDKAKEYGNKAYNSVKQHGKELWNNSAKPLLSQAWNGTKNVLSENPGTAAAIAGTLAAGGLGYYGWKKYQDSQKKKKKKNNEDLEKEASDNTLIKYSSAAVGVIGFDNYAALTFK